jgi:hypothetical protein
MSSLPETRQKLTWMVDLPGGQRRLSEAVLYISKKCETAPYFGLVKLNKILWRCDFESFAQRGQPVTGRQYQRLKHGPAPVEIRPILNELQAGGILKIAKMMKGNREEQRPIALVDPVLTFFSPQDLECLDRAIELYWSKTGQEVSDLSHGAAWKTAEDGEAIPYELAYLSDQPLEHRQKTKLLKLAEAYGWRSQ